MQIPVNTHRTDRGRITEVLPDEALVYFMWSAGLVKIGWTRSIMRRWDELQIRSAAHIELLLVLKGGQELELDLHRLFKPDRIRGEWFQISDTMLGFFKYLDDQEGPTPQGTILDRLAALGGRAPVIGEYEKEWNDGK